ncbi:hypothetical protein KY320_02620 [Candidatus Woesearchaeota archaeon]|nr:hypothetical protein [Candidatus Woesearchaeota archaeon]
MKKTEISQFSGTPTIDLALDTISKNKQAIVFVNTKRGAEKCAEDIAQKIKKKEPILEEISEKLEHALSSPTKQCKRLAKLAKKGVAFHHAGLVQKQRALIEDEFRAGNIKIICSTPTLAAGVDLPAFRTIIRDLKRYGHRGLQDIPVLEYHQQAGRAGRPKFDKFGEAITLATTKGQKEFIIDKYITGYPEDIFSKLAVEPVLRTYLLSLIATEFVKSEEQIMRFFSKTFWAFQFQDMEQLSFIIRKMLQLLEEWEFIISSRAEFTSADKINKTGYRATPVGIRVAQLYLDPLTAHHFMECLKRATSITPNQFSFLQMISQTLELRPLLRVRVKEWDEMQQLLIDEEGRLLSEEPSLYEPEYETFLSSVKTASMFLEWIDEKDEEFLLERYSIRPGELRAKIEVADWLLYSSSELARIMKLQHLLSDISKLRVRLKYGVREELLPLLKLRNIGRIRARKLYRNKIKDIGNVKTADIVTLVQILGKKIAIDIKEQVGQSFSQAEIGTTTKKKGIKKLHEFG